MAEALPRAASCSGLPSSPMESATTNEPLAFSRSGLKHGHGTGKRPHRRAKPVGVHGFLILAVGLTASGEPHPETGIVVIVQAQPGKDGFGVLVVAGRVQVISKAIQ